MLILPIGAMEQHGPHLPLATDLLVIDAFADAVVAEAGGALDLWRLPSLAFSKSNEHAWAAGTVWLSPETLLAVIRDIGRSLSTLAARKLVLLNGHGGNTGLLNVVCRELRLAFGFQTFLLHASLPADHGGDEHPGVGARHPRRHRQTSMSAAPAARPRRHGASTVRNVPTWMTAQRNVRFGRARVVRLAVGQLRAERRDRRCHDRQRRSGQGRVRGGRPPPDRGAR